MSFLSLMLVLVGRVSSPDLPFCSKPMGRSVPPVAETEMQSHGKETRAVMEETVVHKDYGQVCMF